jgi:hypothetical protein
MKGFLLFLFLLPFCALGQTAKEPGVFQEEEFEHKTQRYLAPGYGLLLTTYRDLATSPLYYTGSGLVMNLSWMRENTRYENEFSADFLLSANLGITPDSAEFAVMPFGVFLGGQIYDHYLRLIPGINYNGWQLKLGGAFVSNMNARINPELQNAALGIEVLSNLMLSAKVERDVSRSDLKVLDLWLFKVNMNPERRKLSFQFNLGALNLNYRPGYAYLADGEINGSETHGLAYLMSGHQWSLNGYRLGTRLEFTRYRPNGNGRRYAYHWDAVHAPGRHEAFQMATHSFKYIILIQNNKR